CVVRARTTPIVTVPVALLMGSRSASKLAHSNFTPEGGETDAWLNRRDVQSRQERSFLGTSRAGGPCGWDGVGVAPPGEPCLFSLTYRGFAANPGAHPASTATIASIAIPRDPGKGMLPRVATEFS